MNILRWIFAFCGPIGEHMLNFKGWTGVCDFSGRETIATRTPTRGYISIICIPAVAIYPLAGEHNMPILIANMRATLPDKCVSFNETRVYLARWKALAIRNAIVIYNELAALLSLSFSLYRFLPLTYAE